MGEVPNLLEQNDPHSIDEATCSMTSHSFGSYAEACAYAKQISKNKIKHKLKRDGVLFVVEIPSGQNKYQGANVNVISNGDSNTNNQASLQAASSARQKQAQETLKQWQAESNAKPRKSKSKSTSEHSQVVPLISKEDAIRKQAKLNRGIQLINKLNKLERSREKSKSSVGSGFTGGWISLSQGEKKLGDAHEKRKVDEGIAGTREANKRMRSRGGS